MIAALIGGAALLWVVLTAVKGLVLSIAWNMVMPIVFGLPAIDFWQGIALAFIGSILFQSHTTVKT